MPVRRAEPDDWPALRDVRLRALADAPEAFTARREDEEARGEQEWRDRTDGTFLAEENGRVVGMAGGFVTDSGAARVWGMWLEPQVRGRGLAEQLVDAVEGWARSTGATELELGVSDRAPAAKAAYARMGFEFTPDRDGPWRRMSRPLRHP